VNSVWLSGAGVMPSFESLPHDMDLIIADDVLNLGAAKWANIPKKTVPKSLDEVLQMNVQHVRLALPQAGNLNVTWFEPLFSALKNKQIEQLTLNLGFYEKTLVAVIRPLDTYKFWRKPQATNSFIA